MTQQQLADELLVTNKAVSKWETGSGLPDIAILPTLASVLGVTTDDILSNSYTNHDVNKDNRCIKHRDIRRYYTRQAVVMSTLIVILAGALLISLLTRLDGVNNLSTDVDKSGVLMIEEVSAETLGTMFNSYRAHRASGFVVLREGDNNFIFKTTTP